jgi:hypothetical protein
MVRNFDASFLHLIIHKIKLSIASKPHHHYHYQNKNITYLLIYLFIQFVNFMLVCTDIDILLDRYPFLYLIKYKIQVFIIKSD